MTISAWIDPQLQPFLDGLPRYTLDESTIADVRAGLMLRMGAAASGGDCDGEPDGDGIRRSEHFVPSGAGPVRVLAYHGDGAPQRETLLHIHAGGHVMGMPEMSDAQNRRLAAAFGGVVVSVDYRLSPEHPFPAGLDDCAAVLAWLGAGHSGLPVDPVRIGVAGESAGGGMAMGLCLRQRDRRLPVPCYLSLVAPMLDADTGSLHDRAAWPFDTTWTRGSNGFGWRALLGNDAAANPYAVPARATSLAGMPPTFIAVGGADLFVAENLAMARRLMVAGVPVELHIYPGAYHAFDRVADAVVSLSLYRDRTAGLRKIFQDW